MPLDYNKQPQFNSGDSIISLVDSSPEIKSGARAVIISPHVGTLYAVELPNGELYRWFSVFELQAIKLKFKYIFQDGDLVRVITDKGHNPIIKEGLIVKIVKVITQVPFYDIRLESGKYHRWLADFEIIHPI